MTKTLPDDGRYKWADIVNEIDKIVQKIQLFEDEK
jgi:hypothetical protein